MTAGRHNFKRKLWLGGLGVVCGVALYAASSGCQNDNATSDANANAIHGEMFPGDGDERAVDRFVKVQSASAARADATLNDNHFDSGGELNSLGRAKLDLMMKDDEASLPMVVYVDVRRADSRQGAAAAAERCQDSARRYLADHGMADDRVEFRTGPNFGYRHPARDGLRGLRRLEGEDSSSSDMNNDKPAEMSETSSLLRGSNK